MKTITWKKKLFSSTFNIYDGDQLIGYLKLNPWKDSAVGSLFQDSFAFKKKGFFDSAVFLKSTKADSEILAVIKEKSFSSTSYINHSNGDTYIFRQIKKFFKSKYILRLRDNQVMSYSGSELSGRITFDEDTDYSMIIAGLYLANESWKKIAIVLIIFIIILAN